MTAAESPRRPLTVAIEARIVPGVQGGVEQVAIGLAHGLSKLTDGEEEYVFVTTEDSVWLEPHVGGNCRVVHENRSLGRTPWRARLVRGMPLLASAWGRVKRAAMATAGRVPEPVLPVSDGTAESLRADLLHFTTQAAYVSGIPSIYHPHDLQHVHLPENFSAEALAWRDLAFRTYCEQASMVTVASQWGKRDLENSYGVSADKIVVIPLAPAITVSEPLNDSDARAMVLSLGVVEPYAFYPAQTWPHKNHVRLVEAVALARDKFGERIQVVCSGLQNEHYSAVKRRVRELKVDDLVTFVGFVSAAEVQALYMRATMLVFPSLFEAAGGFGPIFEAFALGVPVATSSVTSLPEQVGDAALVFDPRDIEQMSETMRRLWTDQALRASLAQRGKLRVRDFSWEKVALMFRAHYRRLAGVTMTQEDLALVAEEAPF